MMDDRDGHIPSPLIIYTCTALRHAALELEMNEGVRPKDFKSKVKVDRPDRSNYFNYKNDGGMNASGSVAPGRKLLLSPRVAAKYTFFMTTWNKLPESFQQRVYKNTLAIVKHQIEQAENPTPAVVISMEAAHVDNAILLDYVTSKIMLEKPEIRSTDLNIPMDSNCKDDEPHVGIPGRSGHYKDDGDENDEWDAIPTASSDNGPRMPFG